MVDTPSFFQIRPDAPWVTYGPTVYRSWAGAYAEQQGFTHSTGVENGITTYKDNILNDTFRHSFVSATLYVATYESYRNIGYSPDEADQYATYDTLFKGSFNEWFAENSRNSHLKDYWNNYDGVLVGRQAIVDVGTSVTNEEIASRVGARVYEALNQPVGQGDVIIFDGEGQDVFGNPNTTLDSRLSAGNYDLERLPNSNWYPDGAISVRIFYPDLISEFISLHDAPVPPSPSFLEQIWNGFVTSVVSEAEGAVLSETTLASLNNGNYIVTASNTNPTSAAEQYTFSWSSVTGDPILYAEITSPLGPGGPTSLEVVEVIAPFGGPEEMINDLKAKVFPNEDIRYVALSKDGTKQVKVV